MNENRDLLEIRNLGEFAFAMCIIGLLLAVIAFIAAFFTLHLIGLQGHIYLGLLSFLLWILLNVPLYRSLRRKARLWIGEQRATRQIVYVEFCSVAMLVGLSLLAGEAVGARELLLVLEYLFSFWILALLAYQVFLHFALKYKIFKRDAIRWGIMCIYTVLNLVMRRHA